MLRIYKMAQCLLACYFVSLFLSNWTEFPVDLDLTVDM